MRIPPPQRSQSSTRTEAGEQLFAGFVRWAIRIPKESLSGLPPVTGERQPGALPSAIGPTLVVRVVLAERSEFRARHSRYSCLVASATAPPGIVSGRASPHEQESFMNPIRPLPATRANPDHAADERQSLDLELSFDIVDILGLLVCIRAALHHSPNLYGPIRDRMAGLHLFLLDVLPSRFRDAALASGALG